MKMRAWALLLLAAWGISGCDSGDDAVLDERPHAEVAAPDISVVVESDAAGVRTEKLRELFDGLEQSATLIESYARLDEVLRPTDGPLLLEAFDGTSHSSKRWILARFMGHVGAKDTADRLRAMVRSDESEHVRRNAAFALSWLGHAPAVDDLTASVRNDPVAFVRLRAP